MEREITLKEHLTKIGALGGKTESEKSSGQSGEDESKKKNAAWRKRDKKGGGIMKTKSRKNSGSAPLATAISKSLRYPPLSEVVFEITFPRSFAVENRIGDYQQHVSKTYPTPGDEFVLYLPPAVAFGKSPKPEGTRLTPVRTFVFQNPTGSRIVRVSVVHFSLLVSDYLHFEDYKEALMAAIEPAIEIFQLNRLERVGLRYINKIPVPKHAGPLAYQDYVRTPIDARVFLPHQLSTFLTEVSVNVCEKRKLTIRNGLLPSQGDPSMLTYLLDLDCSSSESVSLSDQDLTNLLGEYHEAIEAEFKRAMTEKYWNYMAEGVPIWTSSPHPS
jgi:uncharacterized protein (TIGR04255 family)